MDPATAARRSAGVAALFDRVADTYDAEGMPWFRPIAQRLVAELAPRPGERALDVGCGRGAVLFPLAAAVAPTGTVLGIDLAERMVEATWADVQARGLAGVSLVVMDATAPDLPAASVDIVAASLVLFFLPDPRAALRSWHGLLAPGGRLGISTFGAQDDTWLAIDHLFTPYLPPHVLDARTSGTAGPFATDAGVEGLLAEAGFAHVRTVTFDQAVSFEGVGHWERWSRSHGQRMMWDATPEDRHDTIREGAALVLGGAATPFSLHQQVRLTLADVDGPSAARTDRDQ